MNADESIELSGCPSLLNGSAEDAESAGRPVPISFSVIPLALLEGDETFRLRDEGDISALATDLARLGQLLPIEVRPMDGNRFQIVCGFRRVAALRFLQRDRVLARIHPDLSDEDALLLALASGIHGTQLTRSDLSCVRVRLEQESRLSPAVADMLEKALAEDSELSPESTEEEVDADELASQLADRLSEINQDLSLLADVFASLDLPRQEEVLKQLRYSSDLVAYLEGR